MKTKPKSEEEIKKAKFMADRREALFATYRANEEFAALTDDELKQMADIAARRF